MAATGPTISDDDAARSGRDRDERGRPEQARPRDRTGRPLPYDTDVTERTEEHEYGTVDDVFYRAK